MNLSRLITEIENDDSSLNNPNLLTNTNSLNNLNSESNVNSLSDENLLNIPNWNSAESILNKKQSETTRIC